jgi:hypothetical protein
LAPGSFGLTPFGSDSVVYTVGSFQAVSIYVVVRGGGIILCVELKEAILPTVVVMNELD